jgi:integrase
MMDVSPFSKGPSLLLKENNQRLRFLSEDEIDRLLDACPPYLNHIAAFCLHTGARRQEALNLKWHQIKNGHVYFEETKTDKPRQVPISDELQELIDRFRGKSKQNVVNLKGERVGPEKRANEHVFLHKGKPVNKSALTHAFIRACGKAEIPYGLKTTDGVTFHTTRHTFGSWLAISGVPIKTIQELMGHKDISMTMRYAHLAENVEKEAVNMLNGLTNKKTRDCHKSVTNSEMDDLAENQQFEITVNM